MFVSRDVYTHNTPHHLVQPPSVVPWVAPCPCTPPGHQGHLQVIFSCIGTEHLRHQFIHLFDNISEGSVFQHTGNSEVYKFISAAVDLFD